MLDFLKEPWATKVVEDFGAAFSMGWIGGGLFQAISGFRNAPSGLNRRIVSSLAAVKASTPTIAGNFAIWGGTFSAFEYGFQHMRKKHDAWNSILSGIATGGILATRKGTVVIVTNAIIGGIVMAVVESTTCIMRKKNQKESECNTIKTKENSKNMYNQTVFFGSQAK